MMYTIQAGNLYELEQDKKLVALKSPIYTVKKTLLNPEGQPCFFANIEKGDKKKGEFKKYVLTDFFGLTVLSGKPGYSKDFETPASRQLLSHAPRMDHVDIKWTDNPDNSQGSVTKALTLFMYNSQNYRISDSQKHMEAEILHNDTAGGWTVEAVDHFSPFLVMGLYIFCRYLDKENEFIVI